jgi:hypothetical protein
VKEAVAGVPLEQFAAVTAALAEAFPLRRVLAIEEIDAAAWNEADRGWSDRLDRDGQLRSWYEHECSAATARLCAEGKPKLRRSGTGLQRDAGTGAAPTFLSRQPIQTPTSAGDEWVEAALDEEPQDPLAVTGTRVLDTSGAPVQALPFASSPSSGAPHRSEGSKIRAMPFQPAEPAEEGTRINFQPLKAPLPFHAPDPNRPSPPPAPPPPPSRPDSPGETQAIRVVRGAGLPFHGGAPPAPAPPPPPKATPTRAPAEEGPPMSLERHAYMCLEIALDPARTDEILARYEVTPEVRSRADTYYRAHLATDAELAARWHRAYASYHAWFTSQPRP